MATLVFTHPNGPNVRPLPVRPFVGCPIRLSVRPFVRLFFDDVRADAALAVLVAIIVALILVD